MDQLTNAENVIEARRLIETLGQLPDGLRKADARFLQSWQAYFERKGGGATIGVADLANISRVGAAYGLVTPELATERRRQAQALIVGVNV